MSCRYCGKKKTRNMPLEIVVEKILSTNLGIIIFISRSPLRGDFTFKKLLN